MTEVLCLMSGFAFGTWVHSGKLQMSEGMVFGAFAMAAATLVASCILTAVRAF